MMVMIVCVFDLAYKTEKGKGGGHMLYFPKIILLIFFIYRDFFDYGQKIFLLICDNTVPTCHCSGPAHSPLIYASPASPQLCVSLSPTAFSSHLDPLVRRPRVHSSVARHHDGVNRVVVHALDQFQALESGGVPDLDGPIHDTE